jgi:outer membrane protein assembly factor BamA
MNSDRKMSIFEPASRSLSRQRPLRGRKATGARLLVTLIQQNGLPINSQQSAGFSVNALLNRRDNDISARRGWMASGKYRISFNGFLGGDSSWQELDAEARAYVPLSTYGRHRIALWTFTSLVTKGVAPYFDVPTIVMDTYGRSARGYQEGRIAASGSSTPRANIVARS